MNETDAVADRTSLVPGSHRLIRAIDGKEGPFTGTLVTYDDAVAVCVDVERLSEWSGWAYSDADHVCGVLDIKRRVDGHDALLPWCTQRVEVFLGQRDASESALTAGELGTLVASLLRGVRELGADADALGDWWLTADGLPLFVHGEGASARALTASLIDRLGRRQSDRGTARILEEISAALRQPRHPVEDDRRWEDHLFARAAPRALRLDVFAPERVSEVAPRLVAADVSSRAALRKSVGARTERDAAAKRRQDRFGTMADEVRTRAADLFSAAASLGRAAGRGDGAARRGDGAARRAEGETPTPNKSRRRSLLLAGSLGIVVLIVGMLWPSDGGDDPAEAASQKAPASGAEPGGETTQTPVPEETEPAPTPVSTTLPTEGSSALESVPALLGVIAACSAQAVDQCPDAVSDGARTPADGVVLQGASKSTATLVDDYGDVAVVRLTPVEGEYAEQMMVLEREKEIWLVRDVYDVAHQPE